MKKTPIKILNCLIIDDEPLARECIENYIREIDFLTTVGVGNNPLELSQLLAQKEVDLVFLDIQMPKMNGIEFLRRQRNLPAVILTTAFPSYALESYALDVVDYLLKPITFTRFYQAVTKARQQDHKENKPDAALSPESEDYFYIKCEHRYERIYFADILFVKALQNYVEIHTRRGKFLTLLFLKNVAEYLTEKPFVRVHKSYIVSIPQITSIDQGEILIEDYRIPLSRNYRESVMKEVVEGKLWKK